MSRKYSFSKFFLSLGLIIFTTMFCFGEEEKTESKDKEKKQPRIIEEIVVTGKTPKQQPLSTVSKLDEKKLAETAPRDLSEVMSYVSGTYVSEGQKNESNIQIRGLSSNRLTLMVDGVPIYEPYFNSFDLNTLTVAGIESVKVIKGANSVLYGPNTLGGVINVLTLRPTHPTLLLNTQFGAQSTFQLSGSGTYTWDKFDAFASFNLDQSDGFKWEDGGAKVLRENSDYKKQNYSAKFYYYPTEKIEVMGELMYYTAEYGIPAATEIYRPRYWRFEDWDRWQLNFGANFPLPNNGSLRTRLYYVKHHNILDAYENDEFTDLQWVSTYDNHSLGAFILGELPVSEKNTLNFSLNAKSDVVKTQGDIGEEWEEFRHQTYSLGVEDYIDLSDQWRLIAGASIDYLKKQDGENRARLNPILGVKYAPQEWVDLHLSLSQKSRFPSMRSLYSTSSGNPDLKDETGRNIELGVSFDRNFYLNAAVFYNQIEDLIQAYRGLEGFKNYENVGKAEIYGFEIQASKQMGWFYFDVNYTYLEAWDRDQDLPLDYVPKSQLNALIRIGEFKGFSLVLWGLSVSKSQVKDGKEPPFDIVDIPGYTLLNASLQKKFGAVVVFVKVENLFDEVYFTEPGFPMKSRTFSFGIKALLEKK